jgi:hypothetical protein
MSYINGLNKCSLHDVAIVLPLAPMLRVYDASDSRLARTISTDISCFS